MAHAARRACCGAEARRAIATGLVLPAQPASRGANPPGRCHCPVESARQFAHPIGPKQPVAFDREIAQPIGMQDFSPTDGEYVAGAASIHAACPFRMSVRDLARFGLLYLGRGRWRDREIAGTFGLRNLLSMGAGSVCSLIVRGMDGRR